MSLQWRKLQLAGLLMVLFRAVLISATYIQKDLCYKINYKYDDLKGGDRLEKDSYHKSTVIKPVNSWPSSHPRVSRGVCGGAAPGDQIEAGSTDCKRCRWSRRGERNAQYCSTNTTCITGLLGLDSNCDGDGYGNAGNSFFGYGYPHANSSNCGLESDGAETLAFVQDANDQVYLVFAHDKGDTSQGGQCGVQMTSRGLSGVSFSNSGDDSGDDCNSFGNSDDDDCHSWSSSEERGSFHWKWGAGRNDGSVLGPFPSKGFTLGLEYTNIVGLNSTKCASQRPDKTDVDLFEIPQDDALGGLLIEALECSEYCQQLDFCGECSASSACAWCSSTQKCLTRTNATAFCPADNLLQDKCCDECYEFTSCSSCADVPGCGWCSTQSTCVSGTAWNSCIDCDQSSWAWTADECPSEGSCERHRRRTNSSSCPIDGPSFTPSPSTSLSASFVNTVTPTRSLSPSKSQSNTASVSNSASMSWSPTFSESSGVKLKSVTIFGDGYLGLSGYIEVIYKNPTGICLNLKEDDGSSVSLATFCSTGSDYKTVSVSLSAVVISLGTYVKFCDSFNCYTGPVAVQPIMSMESCSITSGSKSADGDDIVFDDEEEDENSNGLISKDEDNRSVVFRYTYITSNSSQACVTVSSLFNQTTTLCSKGRNLVLSIPRKNFQVSSGEALRVCVENLPQSCQLIFVAKQSNTSRSNRSVITGVSVGTVVAFAVIGIVVAVCCRRFCVRDLLGRTFSRKGSVNAEESAVATPLPSPDDVPHKSASGSVDDVTILPSLQTTKSLADDKQDIQSPALRSRISAVDCFNEDDASHATWNRNPTASTAQANSPVIGISPDEKGAVLHKASESSDSEIDANDDVHDILPLPTHHKSINRTDDLAFQIWAACQPDAAGSIHMDDILDTVGEMTAGSVLQHVTPAMVNAFETYIEEFADFQNGMVTFEQLVKATALLSTKMMRDSVSLSGSVIESPRRTESTRHNEAVEATIDGLALQILDIDPSMIAFQITGERAKQGIAYRLVVSDPLSNKVEATGTTNDLCLTQPIDVNELADGMLKARFEFSSDQFLSCIFPKSALRTRSCIITLTSDDLDQPADDLDQPATTARSTADETPLSSHVSMMSYTSNDNQESFVINRLESVTRKRVKRQENNVKRGQPVASLKEASLEADDEDEYQGEMDTDDAKKLSILKKYRMDTKTVDSDASEEDSEEDLNEAGPSSQAGSRYPNRKVVKDNMLPPKKTGRIISCYAPGQETLDKQSIHPTKAVSSTVPRSGYEDPFASANSTTTEQEAELDAGELDDSVSDLPEPYFSLIIHRRLSFNLDSPETLQKSGTQDTSNPQMSPVSAATPDRVFTVPITIVGVTKKLFRHEQQIALIRGIMQLTADSHLLPKMASVTIVSTSSTVEDNVDSVLVETELSSNFDKDPIANMTALDSFTATGGINLLDILRNHPSFNGVSLSDVKLGTRSEQIMSRVGTLKVVVTKGSELFNQSLWLGFNECNVKIRVGLKESSTRSLAVLPGTGSVVKWNHKAKFNVLSRDKHMFIDVMCKDVEIWSFNLDVITELEPGVNDVTFNSADGVIRMQITWNPRRSRTAPVRFNKAVEILVACIPASERALVLQLQPGAYKIGEMHTFLRMVGVRVMVRTGGGWQEIKDWLLANFADAPETDLSHIFRSAGGVHPMVSVRDIIEAKKLHVQVLPAKMARVGSARL